MTHVHHHHPPTRALQVCDPINAIMLAESSHTWHEVMHSMFPCRSSFSFYACEFGVVQLVKRPLVARWFESSLALRLHGWSFPGTEDSFQHFTPVELSVGSNFVDSGMSSKFPQDSFLCLFSFQFQVQSLLSPCASYPVLINHLVDSFPECALIYLFRVSLLDCCMQHIIRTGSRKERHFHTFSLPHCSLCEQVLETLEVLDLVLHSPYSIPQVGTRWILCSFGYSY